MSSLCAKDLSEVNKIIWGDSPVNIDVFKRWCHDFNFSSAEPTALIQYNGGPCALLAPIQAVILRDFLFVQRKSLPSGSDVVGSDLLLAAILNIMTVVQRESNNDYFCWVYWTGEDDRLTTTDDSIDPESFFSGLRFTTAHSVDELHAIILSLDQQVQFRFGVLCFLYSVLLTNGLQTLRDSMADDNEPLIDPVHGHASQCLMNLVICGHATPYLFDGERSISGFALKGILKQPQIGYLTMFEALQYCESGWFLKNPAYPIWILASETHFTVLASSEERLITEESNEGAGGAVTIRQAEAEFTRLGTDQDVKTGFITHSQLADLLRTLKIPFDDQSIANLIKELDPEELGVILEQPFLKRFFPNEMAHRRSAVDEFKLIHYNGLEKSNINGQVRYRFGVARLLDPTDELTEAEPVGQAPIDRCLRTKWPTIRIKWDGSQTPSLN